MIVFARFPEPGCTKTRLIPVLGPERAAKLQECLTRQTLSNARALCSTYPCRLEVRFAGGDAERMAQLYGSGDYVPQHGNDLGERLEQAVTNAFAQGVERLVVIGTDCPDLSADVLFHGFRALEHSDVALGQAEDGGYFLIGLNQNHSELFRGITWSTEHVLEQTIAKARSLKCRICVLMQLTDVDHSEDLIACRRYPIEFADVLPEIRRGTISVIVPTFNEEQAIAETLAPLLATQDVEVIVSDGGSTDATVSKCRELGATVVAARKGRGPQMNAGAALASGEVLLFLHADTKLPINFPVVVKSILQRKCVAGVFRLHVNSPDWRLRWIERAANWRSRFLQMPYGDQGLFLPAQLFYEMGGFPNWPLMEDYEFCRRLKRRGRIHVADETAITSARRWEKLGVCWTTLVNQATIAGYHLGIPTEYLAQWYRARLRSPNSTVSNGIILEQTKTDSHVDSN